MSLAIIGIVYPVIFLSELPDKTMVASLALAIRGRPAAVWAGAAAAFALHVGIAVTAGAVLVLLLPSRLVQLVAAALFLAGAVWEIRGASPGQGDAGPAGASRASGRGTALTAFGIIFLAEWGDLTQILTASLAARYHAPIAVGLGAGLALWSVAALAVAAGRPLARLPTALIRRATGLVLLALAVIAAAEAITGHTGLL